MHFSPLVVALVALALVPADPSTNSPRPASLSAQSTVAARGSGARQAPQGAPPQPPPARDTRPAARDGGGVIRGRILSDTGQPLAHARVDLSASVLRNARAVPSDLDGRFEFKNLPAGRYSLRASKNGYVTLRYGQRRAFQAGRSIDVSAGQAFEDAVVRLPRGAVIAGRVLDDLNEPVAGIRVLAYRVRYQNGRRGMALVTTGGETDDLGQFRISGLPPGSYFVGTRGGLSPGGGGLSEEGLALMPTYYPSTPNIAEGRMVAVRAAQEVRGIDIAMAVGRASSIAGTVMDSRGRTATGLSVTVRPAGDSLLAMLNTAYGMAQTAGQFTVRNLMPGDYTLHAVVRLPDSTDQESVDVPVTVSSGDIEGLVVTSAPNVRIAGHITFESASETARPAGVRIALSAPMGLQDWSGRPDAAGDFEIKNIEPGRLTASVDGLPAGWAVKRVVLDGRDVTESDIDLTASTPGRLEITCTDKPTTLSGTVTRDAEPVSTASLPQDYVVVVFGDSPSQWREGSRRVLVAQPDQKGIYKIAGLPPGTYRAIAIDTLDDGEQWNPDFLQWASPRAVLVELSDGEAKTLNLKVTRNAQ